MLRERIIKKDMQKEYLEELKNTILSERKIIAWGTGRGAKKLLQFIDMIGWNGELLFIDSNEDRCKQLFEGYRVISPTCFFKNEYDSDSIILITCADVSGVHDTIHLNGKHEKVVVSDLTSIDLNATETWYDYIWDNIDQFSDVYELLADDKSRDVFAGLLNYRISRDDKYIRDFVDDVDTQYFERELFSIDNIVMVDCGAFIGDTVENFIKLTGRGGYKQIYSFEPDKQIYEKLNEKIKKNGWKNIKAFNLGNYKEKATLCFESGGQGTEMSNHISSTGNIKVEVDAIDNIIHEPVDLIKMDIEGSEYDALLGCKGLINSYKPVLSICIYHKPDDYFTLPNLIHSMNPDYKFYVRQYAFNDNETILYAIDEKHLKQGVN